PRPPSAVSSLGGWRTPAPGARRATFMGPPSATFPQAEVRQLSIGASPWSKHDKWVKVECCPWRWSETVGPSRGFGGTMIYWIESQSTPAIIGIVFSLCYAFAGVVSGFGGALSGTPIAAQF